jgi:adenylate cyclase
MPSKNTEQRKLAAIMFTDMVGYSALSQRNEALALELLAESQRLLRTQFALFNGREVKTTGDGFLIEFPSALQATQCALEIQRGLAARNGTQPPERHVHVRIGIHVGDVVMSDGDIHGDGVNIAARIEPLAEGGGICLSDTVYAQVRNKLDVGLTKLASPDLKNIELPIDVYRVALPWQQRAPVAAKSRAASPWQPSTRTLAGGAIAILVLLVIGVGWWWTTQPRRTPASPETASRITSLAVLPFKNYSADANQEYFADGMTDLLTTELSGIGAITVKSHQSALKFKNSTKSTPEIGEELHVDGIVEGSVMRDGNEVTVNVQLIEAPTDRHLWAKKFERDVTNIFKMRNEVVEAIAHEIQAAISPEQSSRLSSARSVNPDALQEYLLGRQAWNRQSEKGLDEALEHFNRAKEVDPEFALAWAGLADVYWSAADANIPATEAGLKAKAAADRALQLDDSLAEAHTAEGAIAANDFRWADSEREFHRAIELNPNYAPAHWQYGWLLIWVGRIDEAQTQMQRAVELDPLSAVMTMDVCVPYALKKDYDTAIAQSHKAMELDPGFFLPHFGLGWIEILRQNYANAIQEFRAAQALDTNPIITGYLGFTYGRSGQKDKAVETLNELNQLAQRRFVTPFCQALVYAGIGEDSKAIDWLEKAYQERSVWIGWLKVQPLLDPLRSDPRFQALYKKMNFPP